MNTCSIDELAVMPRTPGLAGIAVDALLALLGPMERVGMNPQQWFDVLAANRDQRTRREESGRGLDA